MSNLIRGEFYKLRKSKHFVGMIILSIIVGLILICMWDNDAQHWQKTSPNDVNGITSLVYSFGWSVLTNFIFPLLAGELIIKDFKTSNICKCLSYGSSRISVILSKLIVFILFSLSLELIYTIILVVYVSINYGFWGSLDINYLYLTKIIVIDIICSISSISIIAMVAILTRSNFVTIVSPIIFIVCYSLSFSNFSPYIQKIFSYMPSVAGLLAINRTHLPIPYDIISIFSSFVIFIITIGISLLYVKRKDIK